MAFILISFIAGVLTVLAPCILPLLPVIVGGSIAKSGEGRHRPVVIIISLIVSIVLFTLLLKWSTAFINIPQSVWTSASGIILVLFALSMIFPGLWEKLPFVGKLSIGGNKLLGKGFQKKNLGGDILMGAALGPVFSSCSPTYFVILATVLPESFARGLLYLVAYAIGLGLALLVISVLGQKIVNKLGGVSDPRGWFKRSIGVLFLIVGVFILTGIDKEIESSLLDNGAYRNLANLETRLLTKENTENTIMVNDEAGIAESNLDVSFGESSVSNSTNKTYMTLVDKEKKYDKYHEIVNPSGFVNTSGLPVTVSQYIGKKVVLIDFLTYTCINCIRTFPYLNDWYTKYEDDGFVIIGIHTPEFAFEKNIENVKNAMVEEGIKFPIVLDNDYGTWRAWENNFWPRKYLIDVDGYVVFDHIGEGQYTETEVKIVDALNELHTRMGTETVSKGVTLPESDPFSLMQSPEVYFASYRNSKYVDTDLGSCTALSCSFDYDASKISQDNFALDGDWDAKNGDEFVSLISNVGGFGFKFSGGKVFMVAEADSSPVLATVYLDGEIISDSQKGENVASGGTITIDESKLYNLINLRGDSGAHLLEVKTTNGTGLHIFTLTFGA